MPHKLAVMEYLDEVDEVGKKIKAVNTIVNKEGKLYGYNTDIVGVARALNGVEIKGKNVLLIGAGGAAKTVACFLNQAGGNALYLNRTMFEANNLANEFGGEVVEKQQYLNGEKIDIIINTTPVGMYPKIDYSPIEENLLMPHQ